MGRLAIALAAALLAWPATTAAADPTARWADEIAKASARFAIPEDWIRRVMRVESGGRTMLGGRPIVSSAGAMGLMQLMPGTWREMRDLLGLGRDPHDPADNILAGAAYLRRMYDRFGYPGLFAAYNAGPGRYAAFLSGRAWLPSETRSYVAAVARRSPAAPGKDRAPVLFAFQSASNISEPMPAPAAARGSLFFQLRLSGRR